MNVKTAKRLLREEIWNKLEKEHVARFPPICFGHIPDFSGSEKAAEEVRFLKEWKEANVVFVNPDYAQHKIRENALLDGKTLVMASPRLKQGYVVVLPKDVKNASLASTIKGAFRFGKTMDLHIIPKPDLIVEGSVAVDLNGNRLGKGGGYGDVEIQALKGAFGLIPVVTTVHELQIVEKVPVKEKDEKVSVIVTPNGAIYC